MKRRTVLGGLLTSTGLMFSQGFWGSQFLSATEKTSTLLRMGLRYSLQHSMTKDLLIPWADSLRTCSGNRLNIQIFGSGSLCTDDDISNALLMDTMSIGVISPSLVVPPLPASSLFDSPLLFPNAKVGSITIWELLHRNQVIQEEYALVHLLWSWISAPMLIHTVQKPVRSIQDIQGLKLITWSSIEARIIQAAGGTSVYSTSIDSPLLLQRGLADGVVCPLPPLQSFGIIKTIRHTTEIPLTSISFIMAMNNEVWLGLTPELKNLLTEATGRNMSARCGAFLDEDAARVRQVMLDQGHEFLTISPDDAAQWRAVTAPMRKAAEQRLIRLQIPHVEELSADIIRTRDRIIQELEQSEKA